VTFAQVAVFAYAILSRMAYVLFVGGALRREERPVDEFPRFRRRAAIIMYNDASAFVVLCFVTPGTLVLPFAQAAVIATGAIFVVIGLAVKLWAARTLGSNAYYWHNFFDPQNARGPVSTGPYRYVSNPMYTIGYLPTYGLALITGSLPGLVAAAFAQAAILAFYRIVEKPHFEALQRLQKCDDRRALGRG
jgi:protein-S-isoprenylcysteine O-methyltransferase Ste14